MEDSDDESRERREIEESSLLGLLHRRQLQTGYPMPPSGSQFQQNSPTIVNSGVNTQGNALMPPVSQTSMEGFLEGVAVLNTSSLQRPRSIPDIFGHSTPSISGPASHSLASPNKMVNEDQTTVETKKRSYPHPQGSTSGGGPSVEGGRDMESGFSPAPLHRSDVAIFPSRLGKSTWMTNSSPRKLGELNKNLPFPAKLHYIISNPRYQEYITWCSHGRAWRVLNQRDLNEKSYPIYFRSDKFASFMRQVSCPVKCNAV